VSRVARHNDCCIINLIRGSANAGPSWLSYISVCVTDVVSTFGEDHYNILGALYWNAIKHVCFQRQKVKNGLISPLWLVFRVSVCLLLCTLVISSDWLTGMQYLLCQSRWQMQWVQSFVSMPVTRIQLLFYVGVSEIIDKLVDWISHLRQLWVHCYSVLCSSSLATFSRHYRPVYIWLLIRRRKCHAGWWATQLQYLSVIDLTGTTHKL